MLLYIYQKCYDSTLVYLNMDEEVVSSRNQYDLSGYTLEQNKMDRTILQESIVNFLC